MRIKLGVIWFLAVYLIPDPSCAQEECETTEEESPCTMFERYRSYSGRCNNLKMPEQGATRSIQQRLLPPAYDDTTISSPRTRGVSGDELPNPRKVSQTVHTSTAELDSELTLMVMQWGQFIDHDLSFTPHVVDTKNQCDSCESQNVNISSCFPIMIPSNDNFFRESNCFEFTRSLPTNRVTREQTNVLTSYMDASMVYGNSRCQLNKLRDTGDNSHRMKMSTSPNSLKSLLPTLEDERVIERECSNSLLGSCFLAGDIRVNEHPGLTSMHTILKREHNRIADELKRMNELWENDKVFEETRRIIAAQIQHITYNEYLPHVLGPYGLGNFDLDLQTCGYYSGYNNSCSATTFNEFSTAAFRFGHSMIPSKLTLISKEDEEGNTQKETSPLHDHFLNPDIVSSGRLDDLLRGFTRTPMLPTDRHVTEEVKNHLFEERNSPQSGFDLPALNIQRGRDHGLPGYNMYRQICNLPKATTFNSLSNEMSAENIERLRSVYNDPNDIDLFTGLLSETPLPGAITGPTLTCIIGLQFKNIRRCDRYWYETSDPDIKFSEKQLKEIRSSSLAALLCRNMDENSKIARSPMVQVNTWTNPLVDCEQDIKSIDLEAWRGVLKAECNVANHNILDEASRSVESTATFLGHCDQTDSSKHYSYTELGKWKGSGWYRFTGNAGSRIPDSAPVGKRCGSYKQGWISGSHPTSTGQTVDAEICIQSGSNTCRYTGSAKITHCGSYFVYSLPDVPGPCSTRYCAITGSTGVSTTPSTTTSATTTTATTTTATTTKPMTTPTTTQTTTTATTAPVLPRQCQPGNYRTLSEASRSTTQPDAENCDGYIPIGPVGNQRVVTSPSWRGSGWYKFANPAGTKIATSPPPNNRCGTHATGYMIHSHPTEIGQTKTVQFCFNWLDSSCRWSTIGEVTKCGDGDFVYKLADVPNCTNRYCAVP